MNVRTKPRFCLRTMLLWTLTILPMPALGQPSPAATTAFNSYIAQVEGRLDRQHHSAAFLANTTPEIQARLHRGEFIIERVTPNTDAPGAMLHHWRGTAFVPGATTADLERLLRDFPGYPRYYAPEVLRASATPSAPDHLQATMRVRQKHGITVVMDTAYDVTFTRLDATHGYSVSRSTRIAEIDAPGTPHERALPPGEDHGFLWRLNTYWTWEQRDGGLYMQIESVTLTRSIPTGLGWAVRPFVESVPRESLEFTLRSTANALRKRPSK